MKLTPNFYKTEKHYLRMKKSGKKKENLVEPLKTEFQKKDMLQVIVGASILAVPVGFTEETWELGATLPWLNIIMLAILAIFFISLFAYAHYHRGRVRKNSSYHVKNFFSRVIFTYVFSFLVVAVLLAIINVAPWTTDTTLAIKRTIIVTFPCSMGAAISDVFR